MNKLHPLFGFISIFIIFNSFQLSAQKTSSIYLDSRAVADYINEVQEPFIDASHLSRTSGVRIFPPNDTIAVTFPKNKRIYLRADDYQTYKLVLDLKPSDTVFVVGNKRFSITDENSDTISLIAYFTTSMERIDPLHEKSIQISPAKKKVYIEYGPVNGGPALKAVSKLAAHVYFKETDNQFGRIPLEQLKSTYAKNPFTANNLMRRRSIVNLFWNTIEKVPEEYQKYYFLDKSLMEEYPWQAVLNGDSVLNFEQQVSFEVQNGSYRDQILTSQKALSLASDQINRTGQQGRLLDAKTVAVGMSDFIAERAQEELNLTFFERFKTNMKDTNELAIMFPKTRDLLVDFEISNYKTLLSHARSTFKTDLDNIGLNFPKILSLPKYEKLQNDPNVFNLALIYSLADLAYKEHPVEDILLYACQSLNQRTKELDKAISVRVVDNLLSDHGPVKPNMKIDSLEMLLQKAEKILDDHTKTEALFRRTYEDLARKASWFDDSKNENIYARWDKEFDYEELTQDSTMWGKFLDIGKEKIWIRAEKLNGKREREELKKFYSLRLEKHLTGKKYYGDFMYEANPNEETYRTVFLNGIDNPRDNYTKGFEYILKLRKEPILSIYQQKLTGLYRFATESKKIEYRYIKDIQSGTSQFEKYKFLFEIYLQLESAYQLEKDFWHYIQKHHEQHYSGLLYLDRLFHDRFNVFNLYYVNKLFYQDEFNEEKYFTENLLNDFREMDALEIKLELEKYKELLEIQIDSLFTAHSRENKIPQISLLELRDTILIQKRENTLIKVKHFQKVNDLYSQLEELISTKASSINSSKIPKIPSQSIEKDSTYRRIRKRINELNTELLDTIDSRYHRLETWVKEKYASSIGTISPEINLSFSDSIYNIHLYQFELSLESATVEIVDEETERFFKRVDSLTSEIESSIIDLRKAQKSLNASVDSLEKKYAPDLIKARRNAVNLYTSMEMSMHLLSAFRNPAEPLDSMFIMDTTVVEVSIANEYGITRTYDSLMIKRKYIPDENLKLPGSRWMTVDEFNTLKNDPLQWNIFLGMLYERLRRVEGAPNISATGVALLTTKFFDILHEMDEHRNKVRFKKALRKDIGFKDYYPFIKSTVDLFNTVINTPTVGTDTLAIASQFKEIQKVSEISDEALSMYENIYVKNYGNSIRNAMALLSIFTHSEYDPENPIYNKVLRAELGEELSEKEFKKTLKKQKTKIRKSRRAINAVLTYGTFMSDMINAQTSDQVKNILKSATLPPGSSRIKREVSTSFTVNSYLGGAVAYDQIQDDLPGLEKGAIGASLSVPIGFTYSFSPDRIFKRGGSFSFHVPIFDLGAITAFRANPSEENYQIEQLPEFGWKNLFAPGAFFIWNIRNSPFSIGAGGQIGPQLREITDLNTNVTTSINSTRFPMVFFSVDVPFFNLHTGAKKIVVD